MQMIARLGKEINHPDSIYYWAWKNQIPVFCPALTGGHCLQRTNCSKVVRINAMMRGGSLHWEDSAAS
jgi:deoxyhypusine synthase